MKALITLTILATLTSATSFASVSHKKTTQSKAKTAMHKVVQNKPSSVAKSGFESQKPECKLQKKKLDRFASTSGIQTDRPTAKSKTGVGG